MCFESGLDRQQTISKLIDRCNCSESIIAGLDFAFSFPAWFVTERQHHCVDSLWTDVAANCEQWLTTCPSPFWGRARKKCAIEGTHRYRQTEGVTVAGISPKSVFQWAGGGHVGTGSLRGMAYLPKLRDAGFSIWPFHARSRKILLEIYPRLLTGAVNKTSLAARQEYMLRPDFQRLPPSWRNIACSCEDAFDALVSAFCLKRHTKEIFQLDRTGDPVILLEGRIWSP